MSVLEFDNIHRAYRADEEVLAGVTFSLEAGEVVGLLGRNGAGKTTLIHIAMGMLMAQKGHVRVFGLDPQTDPVAIKKRVGFVSENQLLPPVMRAEEVVSIHRELFPSWDHQLESQLRERFQFDMRSRIKSLSKGQARQLSLLCAVAHRPELLLLDEPAGGLDPAARREFLETSIQLLNESGTTILFSSHYMTDVERLAERIVLLDEGRILLDKPLDDLKEDYALALVPLNGLVDAGSLAAAPGCLRVRERNGVLHAVFEGQADSIRSELEARYEIESPRCGNLPLEDLFVELLGGSA